MSSSSATLPTEAVPAEDAALVARLRAGDERAFTELVRVHHASMLRLARGFVSSASVAEEVVQDAWEAVFKRLDSFEGRSALKTWMYRIVINRAKTRSERERRTIPASSLGAADDFGPVVDPALFQGPDGEYPGHWVQAPRPWTDPERRLASLEVREHLRAALERLPERQRLVVALRDVEGLDAEEVCELLDLRPNNQRVLLHRGRIALRDALADVLD